MRVPSYRKHSSGQARVTIKGRDILLGVYGSPESKEKYARLIAMHVAGIEIHPKLNAKAKSELLIADVLTAYLKHAKVHYSRSTEYVNMKAIVQALRDTYATLPACEFGAAEFQVVRAHWMKVKTRSRQYVNKCMKRTLRVIKWAVAAGMMPADAHVSCQCVAPLSKGRAGELRESKKVQPVSPKLVSDTLPLLTKVQADMVRFMQLTGARPGEVCKLKPSIIDRSEKVWIVDFRDDHKTAHREKTRILYLGPKAQQLIKPYLLRDQHDHCFSPQESEKQRLKARSQARKTPIQQGNSPGTNRVSRAPRTAPGTFYTTGTLAKFIRSACRRGKLAHWHPNQLRHTYGTEIRKQHGLEAAQVLLGHAAADVTQIYAERDAGLAKEIALKIG